MNIVGILNLYLYSCFSSLEDGYCNYKYILYFWRHILLFLFIFIITLFCYFYLINNQIYKNIRQTSAILKKMLFKCIFDNLTKSLTGETLYFSGFQYDLFELVINAAL